MAYFIQPTASDPVLRASFLEAMREFEHADGRADTGGLSVIDLQTGDCLDRYAAGLRDGTSMRPGTEPLRTCEWWWCDAGEHGRDYIGRGSIRHHPTARDGHLSFAVRPSRRREGHGTALLGALLPLVHAQGINPATIVVAARNTTAQKIIEACGGALEGRGPHSRRYWVATR